MRGRTTAQRRRLLFILLAADPVVYIVFMATLNWMIATEILACLLFIDVAWIAVAGIGLQTHETELEEEQAANVLGAVLKEKYSVGSSEDHDGE